MLMSTHTLYFAYGSNINKTQMAYRCPDAVFQGSATLHDYRYIINRRGVATVVPHPGSQVTGILWSLTQADEYSMDRYEGVPLYSTRHFLDVVQGDTMRQALVYLAVERRHDSKRNLAAPTAARSPLLHLIHTTSDVPSFTPMKPVISI